MVYKDSFGEWLKKKRKKVYRGHGGQRGSGEEKVKSNLN